ncbi:MAG: hypothetical protein K8T10_10050 [Candidatus Eremiobacteraeota bacterium]|nr:hypothetical protein [Candidatus Eremiobacteraeota bacterium]
MKKWIQTLKITLLFFILSFGTAFACTISYPFVPPMIAVGFLLFLCFIFYLETGGLLLPVIFALPSIYVFFLHPVNSGHLTIYLYAWILIVALINIIILFSMKDREKKMVAGVLNFIAFSAIIPIFILSRSCPIMVVDSITRCQCNMKNIGTALEMYSTDYKGKYPEKLDDLTPSYLSKLPRCLPTLKKNSIGSRFYKRLYGLSANDYEYQVSGDREAYTAFCGGNNHKGFGVRKNFPSYNNVNGLIAR